MGKIAKRSAKADAFENSCNPNEEWNKKLDHDMERKQKQRCLETEAQRKQRRKKDADYHRQMRSEETSVEQNIRKQKDVDYHYRKRIHEEEEKTRKRLDKLKEENIPSEKDMCQLCSTTILH